MVKRTNEPLAKGVLMVEPAAFGLNLETLADNHFQNATQLSSEEIQARALAEHQALASLLRSEGIQVEVIKDKAEDDTPDSLFPNNWFSTHSGGGLWLYPMCAPSRRRERKQVVLDWLTARYPKLVDYSKYEEEGRFLEGTGSVVIDWKARVAYAAGSFRTEEALFRKWAAEQHLEAIYFHAVDAQGQPIYHTNVLLAFAPDIAIVCEDSIVLDGQGQVALEKLRQTREIISISCAQMGSFCGNVLTLAGAGGVPKLVMSERARLAFNHDQLTQLSEVANILSSPIPTIEEIGGGSARCMLAELW